MSIVVDFVCTTFNQLLYHIKHCCNKVFCQFLKKTALSNHHWAIGSRDCFREQNTIFEMAGKRQKEKHAAEKTGKEGIFLGSNTKL